MQPLKITIIGNFWDSQIYQGNLFLWDRDGRIHTIKWDQFINNLDVKDALRLAIKCAFQKGSLLYLDKDISSDSEVKKLILRKFEKLSKKPLDFELSDIPKEFVKTMASPIKGLHVDSEIYNKVLYTVLDDGLYSTEINKKNKNPVNRNSRKLWDCPILSIKALSKRLSLSAGNEGLFEYQLNHDDEDYFEQFEYEDSRRIENNLFQISDRHSLFSNFNFSSIFNSSDISDSFLAAFYWSLENGKKTRKFEKIVEENEIFKPCNISHLSWGANEKIYRATSSGLFYSEFSQYNVGKPSQAKSWFSEAKKIEIEPWKGEVINGGSALFGNIVECENAMFVLKSDNTSFTIPGPILRWRVFPRSIFYQNHLHVIQEDRIEIFSFNHDYFVPQKEKQSGFIFNPKYMDFT